MKKLLTVLLALSVVFTYSFSAVGSAFAADAATETDNMTKAVMSQKPVTIMYPHSPASRCYENIVSTLETGHAVSQNAGVRSFFRNVFSRKMKNGD